MKIQMDVKRTNITLNWPYAKVINSFIDKNKSLPTIIISTDINLLQIILKIEDRKLNMNIINFIINREYWKKIA